MEQKAQGNIDFLLLVLAGVIVVTGVAVYIKSLANSGISAGKEQLAKNP